MNILRNQKGFLVIIAIVIVGILMIAGVVFLFIKTEEESDNMYKAMLEEATDDENEPKYGYGVQPDSDLISDVNKYKTEKKAKPIIYVRPRLKK